MAVVPVGCIVEGEGEEAALPILLRRIAERIEPSLCVVTPRPVRVHRGNIANRPQELERGIHQIIPRLPAAGGILILLDADDDSPKQLHAALVAQVQGIRSDVPLGIALAKYEYENWFIAAAESLRGQRQLAADLSPPAGDPDQIRDAKGWLRRHMPRNRKYTETADQPALSQLFDLNQALDRSASFREAYEQIEQLLRALMPPAKSTDS